MMGTFVFVSYPYSVGEVKLSDFPIFDKLLPLTEAHQSGV
jgi:hypothetical protein